MVNIIKDLTQRNNELLAKIEELEKYKRIEGEPYFLVDLYDWAWTFFKDTKYDFIPSSYENLIFDGSYFKEREKILAEVFDMKAVDFKYWKKVEIKNNYFGVFEKKEKYGTYDYFSELEDFVGFAKGLSEKYTYLYDKKRGLEIKVEKLEKELEQTKSENVRLTARVKELEGENEIHLEALERGGE